MSNNPERQFVKVDPLKIKHNDLMAIIQYVKVKNVFNNGETLSVIDLTGGIGVINVNGKSLIQNSLSADFFEKEEKVTMTRLAELFCESSNRPLTVCFIKKDGSERVLRGKWLRQEVMMGRSYCEDMDIDKTEKEDGIREVDHRTIQWLIVDGMKYVLKSKK